MTNGAARWMNIFGLQFQPSELAKMAVIIAVSYILAKNQEEDEANPRAFKYIMWITGLICALIAPENLSTAALLFGVVFLMMIIGRIPFRKLAILVGSIAVIGIFTIGVTMLVPDNTNIKFLHRMTTCPCLCQGGIFFVHQKRSNL